MEERTRPAPPKILVPPPRVDVLMSETDRAAMDTKRAQVAEEILSTEVTYVTNLMILTNGFMKPLEDTAILKEKHIRAIFSTINSILAFHKEFIKTLEELCQDYDPGAAIGQAFLSNIPYFNMYKIYAGNYDHSIATYKHLKQKKRAFADFLDACQAAPSFNRITLPGYLIMPIQRIPRYEMLLVTLLKSTSATHPDYKALSKAVTQIKDMANEIDVAIRLTTSKYTLMDRQAETKARLTEPHRYIIKQGEGVTDGFSKGKKSSRKVDTLGKNVTRKGKDFNSLPKESQDALLSVRPSGGRSQTKSRSMRNHKGLGGLAELVGGEKCELILCNDALIMIHADRKAVQVVDLLRAYVVKDALMPAFHMMVCTPERNTVYLFPDDSECGAWYSAVQQAITSWEQWNGDNAKKRKQYTLQVDACGVYRVKRV